MRLGIVRLYSGEAGKVGFYNIQELGLAKALEKLGIETYIFFLIKNERCIDIIENEISEKIKVLYLPAKSLANHGIISPRFLKDFKIDILHLLSDNQLMVPSFIKFCIEEKIPMYNYIGTIESDTKNKLKKILMNYITKRNIKSYKNSMVITKTDYVKSTLEKQGIQSVKVISVGLDIDIIPKVTQKKSVLREIYNIKKEEKILLFVGRLEEYKNPIKAIEILGELNKKCRNYKLIIIGQGSLETKLKSKAKSLNIDENIIWIDKIENKKIHQYYKFSDFFLNFNENEIFGMSILEAMNQGCRVIAKTAAGPNFIINNKIDGFLVDDFNFDKWIEIIEDNINNYNVQEKARQKIKNNFNWDVIALEYIKLFSELEEM